MGHLHNGILLGHKKEKFTLCNSVDGPGEHYDFTHMWNLKHKLNKTSKTSKTMRDRLREQAENSGRRLGGGGIE